MSAALWYKLGTSCALILCKTQFCSYLLAYMELLSRNRSRNITTLAKVAHTAIVFSILALQDVVPDIIRILFCRGPCNAKYNRCGNVNSSCSFVEQVRAPGEVWCRTAITHKPPPPRPAAINAGLHPAAPDMVRTAALLLDWISRGARWLLGAVDRQNVTGTQDDLKVASCTRSNF